MNLTTTNLIRIGACAFAAMLLSAALGAGAADLPQAARAFINARCTECHDSDSNKGGLDLTTLPVQLDDPALEARWTLVHDRVQRGEMPPKKKAVPPAGERDAFLQSLGGFLGEHDAARQAVSGRVVLRRLNRVEYENTVHDLLKIDVPLASMLPEDATADGFDNVSQALRLSVTQIDSYLQAADAAIDAAVNLERDPRINLHFSMLDMPQIKDLLDRPHGMTTPTGTKFAQRFGEKDDAFLLFMNETFGPTLMRQARAEYTGKYRVRVSMFAHQSTGHPVVVARWMVNDFFRNRTLANLDLIPGQPRQAEFTVWIEKGWMLTLSATGLTEVAPDGTTLRQVGGEKFKGPGIGVRWVEFQGPMVDTWPPPSVGRVFGDVPIQRMKKMRGKRAYELAPATPVQDADKAVLAFAARAFRRPVTTEDASRYLRLAHEALDHDAPFESAVRRACKAILTSPQFLFLQESRGRLDDYALASRLSYFLWSTMPDDELLQLAAQGKLHHPATLRAQTDRMLASPKAHEFTRNFCGQWLNLRAIDATMPDRNLYPEYDGLLKDAMIGETEAFFEEMLRSNLGVRTLIDSDFAMLNRRLAEHYGIPGVLGEQFRKVPLPPQSHRGGILTQASILKVTANGTVTSPVVRGAWVMRRILGYPIQPPPANAGSIEPDTRGATTIREQLSKHRRMASCSVCHQYMDPPGFAMENYDVIGGWRPWYRVQGNGPSVSMEDRTTCKAFNVRKGPPIDPSGELTDGRSFADIDQLKKLLLDQQDAVARNLANKLITYATGAGITFADRAAVQDILDKARPDAYGLRTLVQEIVQSRLFQTK
jgi:mono/diheme cytochrome c family protein